MTTHRHQTPSRWGQIKRARWGQIKLTFPSGRSCHWKWSEYRSIRTVVARLRLARYLALMSMRVRARAIGRGPLMLKHSRVGLIAFWAALLVVLSSLAALPLPNGEEDTSGGAGSEAAARTDLTVVAAQSLPPLPRFIHRLSARHDALAGGQRGLPSLAQGISR